MTIELQTEGKERFASVVKADLDPTDQPPEFAFTTGTDRPSTWVAGSWAGTATQSGTTWTARAVTPLLGGAGSGAEIELEVGKPLPWVRFTVLDELIVRPLAKITVKG
jgi:hypothetical protein